ncbi:conjugal transfer pilus assembly protein TraK [Duganella sp. FT92W]|uniref:Conjugal transfer pilus assembly protein TraK n=1 Tax=Pseudoduganella rivuli TaxID=2666085 RepID=A0A7X2IIR9_9BURK|nr:type-F conjugative transfer system secretin TraK [Pseudoduganella rivuli]MRV70571.1 conjugal transfer pilus assembly protein TraK [Pseudoduganella rivuli]
MDMPLLPLQLATLLLYVSLPAPAAQPQRKEVRDGLTVEAIIAQRETTRIRIEGAKILNVVGNVYSSANCDKKAADVPAPASPVNPAGEFVLSCDTIRGDVYIRPVGTVKKPLNIFVSSDAGTYTLILRTADIPAETITLVDPQARLSSSRTSGNKGTSTSHIRALKNMLAAMATERTPDDIRVEEVYIPLQLWREASLVQTRRYERDGLTGERYTLTNTSDQVLTVAEQEFDRANAEVLAVAIENMNLQPGATTQVYVIRRGE